MHAREAAYLAILASSREEIYASDWLDQWANRENPATKDLALAREIALGSIRRRLSLDYLAKGLSEQGKLSLKGKEKALLRSALYQFAFMDRIPHYAIGEESLELAKKYCHQRFAKFLNALLRKAGQADLSLPEDDWAIRYSFPPFFVKKLIEEYGKDSAQKILEVSNRPGPAMARVRGEPKENIGELVTESPFPVRWLKGRDELRIASQSPNYAIQNVTQATLIGTLCQDLEPPKAVLDLCAAPGGKTLAVHDLFPQAELFANDFSQEKIRRLEENLERYQAKATLSCGPGQNYPTDRRFPLIILDLPCSNTGVLAKRTEARWRLSPDALEALFQTQSALIKHANELLEPGGRILLITCSILQCENERLVRYAESLGLRLKKNKTTILPDLSGADGGFGCSLTR